MDIPEYYRQFQQQSSQITNPEMPEHHEEQTSEPTQDFNLTRIFKGHNFTIEKPERWLDRIIYTFTGPMENGIQHNIMIAVEENNPFNTLLDYADWHIHSLEAELKECRLLKKDKKVLNNGFPAYEAIFSWYPEENLKIIQQQIFTLANNTGFKLTASFTEETHKTLGPVVEQMMLSFNPLKLQES